MNQPVDLSPAVKKAQIALTVIGLSGIILPFFPELNFSESALGFVLWYWNAGRMEWLLFVTPSIVLPLLISSGYMFWLATGRFPRWALIVSYVASAIFVVSVLAYMQADQSWTAAGLIAATLVGAIWFSFWGIRCDLKTRGLVLMQSCYIPIAIFQIVIPFGLVENFTVDDLGVGWFLSVVLLMTYLAQIALAAKRLAWVFAVPGPMACMVASSFFFS